jgi:predicted membrane-bound mannosyltransferase
MLSTWFSSPAVAGALSLCKLWLFNNALGDDASPALATLIAAR